MPASHSAQLVRPADGWYWPDEQSVHLLTIEFVEYLPALHSLHELAPAPVPVLVIEPARHGSHDVRPARSEYSPAWQSLHAATGDAECLPAAHAVHVVAPVAFPVFVTDPAAHSAHDESVDALECLPAAHAVHVVAPSRLPVLVIEPAWQPSQ